MKLTWTQFSGIRPKVDPRLLPDGNAQVAENVYTDRGGLRPLRGTRDVMALAKTNVLTIYRFGRALASETEHWFHWTMDVDVVKGPIADDTDERTYWTGDGPPKYTTASLGVAGTNLPTASRPLGVSAPTQAPLVSASGAIPTTPVEKPDLSTEDPNDTITVQEPETSSETRVYIYTFVSDMGEESAPSAPATVNIIVGQGVQLSGLQTSATNGAVLNTKRIYRAQQGAYLFVAEVPIGTTTYTDTLASDALGEMCPSVEWDEPPADLKALTGGPNGMMAGIDGYTVRFCEPFRPHAWPQMYSQTVDYPTVGLGQFGQSFLVLTTGLPYIIDGVHPANVTMAPAQFYQPCVSKRSIVSTGGDVMWASPDGLVSMGATGPQVLTAALFTPEDWRERVAPQTLIGAWHEGAYIGSFEKDGARHGFMFRPGTQEWIDLPTFAATAMYRDTVGDALYACIGDHIHKFRDGDPLSFTWKSQETVTPLSDFVAARVTGEYPVTFRLFKDDTLRFTKTVTSDEPFKLPGRLARTWEIELSGSTAIQGVTLATSESEA